MKALSIRQPWAWLIVSGHKTLENRSWHSRYRGPVLIHASRHEDCYSRALLTMGTHPVSLRDSDIALPLVLKRGGIVGLADIVDCIGASTDPWFVGPWAFVLNNARPLPFHPCRGRLGFFNARHPDVVEPS